MAVFGPRPVPEPGHHRRLHHRPPRRASSTSCGRRKPAGRPRRHLRVGPLQVEVHRTAEDGCASPVRAHRARPSPCRPHLGGLRPRHPGAEPVHAATTAGSRSTPSAWPRWARGAAPSSVGGQELNVRPRQTRGAPVTAPGASARSASQEPKGIYRRHRARRRHVELLPHALRRPLHLLHLLRRGRRLPLAWSSPSGCGSTAGSSSSAAPSTSTTSPARGPAPARPLDHLLPRRRHRDRVHSR